MACGARSSGAAADGRAQRCRSVGWVGSMGRSGSGRVRGRWARHVARWRALKGEPRRRRRGSQAAVRAGRAQADGCDERLQEE
eukprot:scaffold15_cov354-Prasinococcus_capsulatus_cf.AAC.1